MGSLGQRFSAAPLAVGLAFFGAMACGGAASTPLDQPATTAGDHGGDDMSTHMRDATSGSSSSGGGHEDATVPDEASLDDGAADASDEFDDGGGQGADDGGPEAGSLCGMCSPGNLCCMTPGAFSYRQCYSLLCGGCCR